MGCGKYSCWERMGEGGQGASIIQVRCMDEEETED